MIHCTYLLFKLASLVNSHLGANVLAKALFGSLIAKKATFGLGCSSNQPCPDKDYSVQPGKQYSFIHHHS